MRDAVVEMSAESPNPIGIAWRRLDSPGHDAAILREVGGGWRLEGAAVFLEAGVPCHLSYVVALDVAWHTRSALVRGWYGPTAIDLQVDVDGAGHWILNGHAAPAVAGAIDIDLAFTPATNLLPIRRLALPVGASAPVVAAWLRFPEFDLRPLDQVYHRATEDTYHYSSHGATFSATMTVSQAGFVTAYSGLWVEERG